MNESLYIQFKDWFKQIAKTIEERVNGKKTALTYMYKTMLKEELSADLKWNTLTVNSNIVAADVVSLDSSLPLKKRDSIGTASGDIPKLGMKMQMTEKQMSDIDVLKARNVDTAVLVDKIFNDEVRCVMGIHEKLEYMFLQALSSGVTVIDDDNNVGTGIRVDFGYKPENKFGVTKVWSDSTATPLDDIKRVMKEAKAAGDFPRYIMMDESTFDNFAANSQTREQFAFSQNFVGTQIPVPDLDQVNAMMQKRYKLNIVIVDRTVTVERDGVKSILTPWDAGKVILLSDANNVGKLYYGILAEETRQSKAALYAKSGAYILTKKWSHDEPFAEFTSSQALVIPVIDNVSSIYSIDSEEATSALDAGDQTEADAFFIYDGTSYTLQSVVDGINAARAVDTTIAAATIAQTDVTLSKKIDKLSEAGIALFEAELIAGV